MSSFGGGISVIDEFRLVTLERKGRESGTIKSEQSCYSHMLACS
jgi:hypothetical protein